MKRSFNEATKQLAIHFPTHGNTRFGIKNLEQLLKSDPRTMQCTKYGWIKKEVPAHGHVKSKGKKPEPIFLKRYGLSDKLEDVRYYPAYMKDREKVKVLIENFAAELHRLVMRLSHQCRFILNHANALRVLWPKRNTHTYDAWLKMVKQVSEKIKLHPEITGDGKAFSSVMMQGKRQAFIIDFLLKHKAAHQARKFSRLAQQFFI